MRFRNVGRFFVSGYFFRDLKPLEGLNLFHNMVVVDVHHDFNVDRREYVAIHPDFAPVDAGALIPEYTATFPDGMSAPTWVPVPRDLWQGRLF